jgi:hypothetical protein
LRRTKDKKKASEGWQGEAERNEKAAADTKSDRDAACHIVAMLVA